MGVSSLDGTRKLKLKRTQTEEAALGGREVLLEGPTPDPRRRRFLCGQLRSRERCERGGALVACTDAA